MQEETENMRSLNGKRKSTYICEGTEAKIMTKIDNKEIDIFVVGCGFTFKTCGNPQECPKCHLSLPIDKEVKPR